MTITTATLQKNRTCITLLPTFDRVGSQIAARDAGVTEISPANGYEEFATGKPAIGNRRAKSIWLAETASKTITGTQLPAILSALNADSPLRRCNIEVVACPQLAV